MLPKRRDIGKVEVSTPHRLFLLFVWKSNATGCSVFYLATPPRIYLESQIGQVTQQECEPGWVHRGLACCSYLPTSSYFLPPIRSVSFWTANIADSRWACTPLFCADHRANEQASTDFVTLREESSKCLWKVAGTATWVTKTCYIPKELLQLVVISIWTWESPSEGIWHF